MARRTGFFWMAMIPSFFLSLPPVWGAENKAPMVAEANNQFAFGLYRDLSKSEKNRNIFISPFSISSALAMTYERADHETAAQMRKVLHFPDAPSIVRQGYRDLEKSINRPNKGYELSTANSLWPQKGYPFLKGYLETVEKNYGGKTEEVDYGTRLSRTDACKKINGWTSGQTKDKIPEIISPEDLTELTRMVLVNAVYFKGSWAKAFQPAKTRKMDFYSQGAGKIQADMMSQESEFPYAQFPDLSVLELPYRGDGLCMLVVLPKDRNPAKAEASLSGDAFHRWLAALSPAKIELSLPKFKIHCQYSLTRPLQRLGMPLAFDEQQADFSKMTGTKGLHITDVIHATLVDVNEAGTEAAGATAVIMGAKCASLTPEFTADHPFFFFIYDKTQGNILFMGKIDKPAVEKNGK